MDFTLTGAMVALFRDAQGHFYDTGGDHETLLLRPRNTQDNAVPSGSAQAALALLQLAAYGDRPEWRGLAEAMLAPVLEMAVQYPTAFARWLSAADFALGPLRQVAIVGNSDRAQTQSLLDALWQAYRPHLVAAIAETPAPTSVPALLRDRPLLNDRASACVCQDFVCSLPVTDAVGLLAQV